MEEGGLPLPLAFQYLILMIMKSLRFEFGHDISISQVTLGTIHLRRRQVLGGEGYPHMPMVQRSQYIRIKNPLHKHFAGMPMVRGKGSKIVKICRRLKWMVPKCANPLHETVWI